jgi:4-hydroxybenzoyl-CoA reductase subunit beta
MLRLNRFTYLEPRSVSEAIDMQQEHGDDAEMMAGGTDVLVNIKHRLVTPKYVIGLRRLRELQTMSVGDDGWLDIGSGVTLQQVERDPYLGAHYPALAHSAYLISTPQVRAVGTIGGNLCLDKRCNYYNQSFEWRKAIGFCMKKDSEICRVAPGGDRCWAVASADTVPVLVALRADATVTGPGGSRRVPVEQLHVDDGLIPTTLRSGEIVTSIHLPPRGGWTCVYRKFRLRQSFDFPLVGVAVALKRGAINTVEDARIVLTAVTAYPERAIPAENLLRGRQLEASAIADAGQTIFKFAKPMDNTAGTIFHRKRMARVLAERALLEIAGHEA